MCEQNPEVHTCVLEAYQTRLVQLAIADPTTVAPPVVTYQCPADAGPLTAQFYNQFAPPTAVLYWKGDQQILFLAAVRQWREVRPAGLRILGAPGRSQT